MPDHPGMYWAKNNGHTFFNLIVIVGGEAPFFTAHILDLSDSRFITFSRTTGITEWGPEIIRPEA
jgi:hypothetical protein